jgi:class 3 adenylate cyclase
VTLAAILHRHARIVADQHNGRLVKTIGDATLCVFPDANAGLAAVVALHAGYRAECAQRDSEALPVHSGLHVGELVIAPDGDVFGASVNLAARLQTLAGPDELVASTAAAAMQDASLTAQMLPARRSRTSPNQSIVFVCDPAESEAATHSALRDCPHARVLGDQCRELGSTLPECGPSPGGRGARRE